MNIVEIIVTAKNLTAPAFAEAKAGASGMESAMSKVNKTALVGAAAMTAFIGESISMASKFDSEMALLHTQAGVAQDQIAGLSRGVLNLSGVVAQDPNSLAESLFHVESNFESMGITSEQALKLTETAAKGATIGHADLVDVTNALTAAVAAGIPGVENLDQAMGVLNATVGVGDMKMQDLASAFGSGMVATVKGFGLSITDVGAALAVFGDNNIRGSLAGNQLRMSVMALAKPVSTSEAALKTLGITSTTLANDMQKGGLKLALEDLVDRLHKAGISAEQQGQVITDAFGRKAGAGLNVLVGQMDRLESKYPALEEGANNFGEAWKATQQTFAFQTKSLQNSLDALMISLGEKLIPYVQRFTTYLLEHKKAVIEVAEGAAVLLGGLIAFAAVAKVIAIMQSLYSAVTAAGVAMTAFRTRVAEAELASIAAGGSVSKLGAIFAAMSTKAKFAVAATGIGLIVVAAMALAQSSEKAAPDVDRMTTSLGELGRGGKAAGELTKTLGADLEKLGHAVDRVAGRASGMDKFNDVMNKIFTLGMGKSNSLKDAQQQIGALDEGLANMVNDGHADIAAAALKRLQDAMVAQGKNPNDLTSHLTKYDAALSGVALAQEMAADSMGALGKEAMVTTEKLDEQTNTAKGLKDAIVALNDVNRAALDSMAGFEEAIDAASKAVEDNGRNLRYRNGELDLSTEKARAEEKALSDLASKTEAAAVAALNNGDSMDKVNAIYDKGREKLQAVAMQMGLTKQQARDLANQILETPDKTAHLRGDLEDLKAKLAEADQALRSAKGEKRVQLLAEKDQLTKAISDAQKEIDSLRGKTVQVMVKYSSQGSRGALGAEFAHGGIIGGAATGGPRGGLTWVGEQGPELVRLPGGSTVIPAGQSRTMAGPSGGGRGVGALQVEWVGGNAGDEFMSWLRKNIRIRGGDVQAVLGRG